MAAQRSFIEVSCAVLLNDAALSQIAQADFGRWVKLLIHVGTQGEQGSLELTAPCACLCGALQVPGFAGLLAALARLPYVEVIPLTNETVRVTFTEWARFVRTDANG